MVDTVTDLKTGNQKPYMYLGEDVDVREEDYEVDDTVNIPVGEYEDLIEDARFLEFLEETVGPEVWAAAQSAYDEWNEENEEEDDIA